MVPSIPLVISIYLRSISLEKLTDHVVYKPALFFITNLKARFEINCRILQIRYDDDVMTIMFCITVPVNSIKIFSFEIKSI